MSATVAHRPSDSSVNLVLNEELPEGSPDVVAKDEEEAEQWDDCLPQGCCMRDITRIITFCFLLLSILFDLLAMTTTDWITYRLHKISFDGGMPWGMSDYLLSGLQRGIMGASVMAAIFAAFAAAAIIFECTLWYCQGIRIIVATAALIFAAFFLMLIVWVFGIALAILSATSMDSHFDHIGYSYAFSVLSNLLLLPCTVTYVRKCLSIYAQEELRADYEYCQQQA